MKNYHLFPIQDYLNQFQSNRKIYIKVILGFAVVIILGSCQKNNLETTSSGIPKEIDCDIQLPTLRNQTLAFNSTQHLQEYYNWLKSSVYTRDTVLYPTQDSLLSVIENALNFRSVRNNLLQISIERNDEEDWLRDDIRKSILNEDYEVVIDGYKYVYYSENQIYKFPESDYVQEQMLKELTKGDDEIVPVRSLRDSTELLSKSITWRKQRSNRGGGDYASNCSYSCDRFIQRFACDPLKIRLNATHLADFIINEINANITNDPVVSTNWMIDFGDGSEPVFTEGWSLQLDHRYPVNGNYTIKLSVGYEDYCGEPFVSVSDIYYEPIEVSEGCYNGNKSVIAHDESYGKRMTSELWVKHDIFGEHQVATTKSYEWKSNWLGNFSWRSEDAYVLTDLWWAFRDEDCNYAVVGNYFSGLDFEPVLETDWCSSCDSKRAGKTVSGQGNLFIADDEVRSRHKVINEGIVLERELILDFCN